MEPGYIGLATRKGNILSALIRFFTKSKFSHCFIITQDIFNIPTVHEADMSVRLVPFESFYKAPNYVTYTLFKINEAYASKENIEKALAYCHSTYSGTKYGYASFIWLFYRSVMSFLGKDVSGEHNWFTDGLICSELVYYFLEQLNPIFIPMLSPLNADTIEPADLEKLFLAHPEIFSVVESKV